MTSRFDRLNAEVLTPLVRRILGNGSAGVTAWDHEVIHGAWDNPKTNLAARFCGKAMCGNRERDWSLFLKIPRPVRPGGDGWQREPLFYGSGLLDDIPGPVEAPRCAGVEEVAGDEPWIWIEEVVGVLGTEWSMNRFYKALEHLGEFQGAYLCGRPLPDVGWMDRRHLLREELADSEEWGQTALEEAEKHPLAAGVFADGRGRRLRALMQEQSRLLDAVDRLPATLTHADLNPGNMIAPGGSEQRTVLIDWHFSGAQMIGSDVSNLIGCCSIHGGPVYGRVEDIVEPAIDAYVRGMDRAGWRDGDLVRFACLAHLALCNTIGIAYLAFRSVKEGHPLQIRDPERLEEQLGYHAQSLDYLLGLSDTIWELHKFE